MTRRGRIAAAGTAGAFAAIQFLRPVMSSNPEPDPARGISAHVPVPAAVDSLLRRSCYDCHSFETRWPVYSRVAPIAWLVQADVLSGRADLNFSHWRVDPDEEPTPAQRLRFICADVRRRVMPPRAYLLTHPSARLSERDVGQICAWADGARRR